MIRGREVIALIRTRKILYKIKIRNNDLKQCFRFLLLTMWVGNEENIQLLYVSGISSGETFSLLSILNFCENMIEMIVLNVV